MICMLSLFGTLFGKSKKNFFQKKTQPSLIALLQRLFPPKHILDRNVLYESFCSHITWIGFHMVHFVEIFRNEEFLHRKWQTDWNTNTNIHKHKYKNGLQCYGPLQPELKTQQKKKKKHPSYVYLMQLIRSKWKIWWQPFKTMTKTKHSNSIEWTNFFQGLAHSLIYKNK